MVKTEEILRFEKCPQEKLGNKKKEIFKLRSFAHEENQCDLQMKK